MPFLTLKDFVAYNNPCFNCDNIISIALGYGSTFKIPGFAQPNMASQHAISFSLRAGYHDYLWLQIDYITNKISSSNEGLLKRFIDDKALFVRSHCTSCGTEIITNPLSVNFEKSLLELTSVRVETLAVNDGKNIYCIKNNFETNSCILTADKLTETRPGNGIKLRLSPLPLYKFKNKEEFIKRLKVISIFA